MALIQMDSLESAIVALSVRSVIHVM